MPGTPALVLPEAASDTPAGAAPSTTSTNHLNPTERTNDVTTSTADLATMTGPEAYSRAVEYALKAAEYADKNPNSAAAHQLAAVSRAFAAIAQAEATARASAKPGYLPGGGWGRHTHPDEPYAY